MRWLKSWALAEWIWVGLFVLVYLRYLYKVTRVSRLLSQRSRVWIYKLLLRTGLLGLIITAILGPLAYVEQQQIQVSSKDIFFCVDASLSMDAEDVYPSRIGKTKLELKKMIAALAGNRMGLIVFSSEAFMQCPLTYDVSALALFVDAIRTDLMPRGGTDFGSPFRLVREKLALSKEQHHQPTAQILVFISDGEDFGTETVQSLAELREAKIMLFSLGVGSKVGSQIPTNRGPRRDKAGNTVHTRLVPEQMQRMSKAYFEITPQINQRPQLTTVLKQIKGTIQERRDVSGSANMYRYFLYVALFLCILDVVFPVRLFRI